ncbi:MAG: hypothetical protein ACXWZF_08120 [Actinomycetota bacterium]
MLRILVFALLSLSLAACADPGTPATDGDATAPAPQLDERRLGVYQTLISELVGAEPMEWRRVYILTGLCSDAADPMGPEACDDSFSEAERTALRERLDIEHLRFIDDPAPLYDDEWMQGPPHEIVLTLGPIVERSGEIRVGASYGCGGLCGSGSTYVLEERGGDWSVVGQRGPMWIA